MISTRPSDAVGSVISSDGTGIGYRQMGDGPGLILVHGGMQSTQNLTKLARALCHRFTVYLPDRRGRGLSVNRANARRRGLLRRYACTGGKDGCHEYFWLKFRRAGLTLVGTQDAGNSQGSCL